MRYSFLFYFFLLTTDCLAESQERFNLTKDSSPITIDAQNSVVCDEIARKCVATGSAKAQKGTSIVYGDVLTVFFTEDRKITAMTAEGHVRMETPTDTAYGEHAHYDVGLDRLVVTGGNLKLVTAKETLTARDSIEYWRSKNQGIAKGAAVLHLHEKKQVVRADKLVAHFVPDSQQTGKTEIERVEATGNVLASSPTDIVTGNRGTYHGTTERVEVFGNVKINQGGNIIQGGYGRANLKTNVAEIFPAPPGDNPEKKSSGRISGIIIPKDVKSQKKKEI